MSKKIGFIGLGSIGKPMARNILKKGYPLWVFDVRNEPMVELESQGAKVAKNPKELASMTEVIITIVPGPRDTREVIFGKNGVLEGLRPGSILIDMSTSLPTLTREIASKLEPMGCKMLDAPVTRGIPDAEKGTLAALVGGEREVLDECRNILGCMAKDILYIGKSGMGHAMKLVNQSVSHTEIISICGAFALGTQAGIDAETIFTVLSQASGNSFMLQYKGRRLLNRDFEPGAAVDIAYKDLDLATTMARDLNVPLLLPNIALETFKAGKAVGLSRRDSTSIITIFEHYLGRKITEPVIENRAK